MITNGDEHNSAGYAYTTSCLVKGKFNFIITDGPDTRNLGFGKRLEQLVLRQGLLFTTKISGIFDDFSKWSSYKNPFFG